MKEPEYYVSPFTPGLTSILYYTAVAFCQYRVQPCTVNTVQTHSVQCICYFTDIHLFRGHCDMHLIFSQGTYFTHGIHTKEILWTPHISATDQLCIFTSDIIVPQQFSPKYKFFLRIVHLLLSPQTYSTPEIVTYKCCGPQIFHTHIYVLCP